MCVIAESCCGNVLEPLIARALARWGHVVLPLVLVGIGLVILIRAGAFGL